MIAAGPEWGTGVEAALAMGARAIAPPIAAAANHGATYLIVVFMMFPFAGAPCLG